MVPVVKGRVLAQAVQQRVKVVALRAAQGRGGGAPQVKQVRVCSRGRLQERAQPGRRPGALVRSAGWEVVGMGSRQAAPGTQSAAFRACHA